MKKSLLFRLLRLGAIPKKHRPILVAEGIVVADEGMAGRLSMKNVRGPGKRYIHRTEGFSGCLAVTRKRVVCFAYWKRQIQIFVDDPRISNIFIDVPKPDILTISFESAFFREQWSGVMEFQFRTAKAQQFFDAFKSIGAQPQRK